MKVRLFSILLLWLLIIPRAGIGREIVDMSGRKVTIPETIATAVAVSPPGTYLLYAIDPTIIGGLNFPLIEKEQKYTLDSFQHLPVIGGMVGQSRTLNREVLLQVKPDFILYWVWKDDAVNRKFAESLTPFNFPLVSVRLDRIEDYPKALLFMSDILNKPERGRTLHDYALETIEAAKAVTATIPAGEKVRVYYAEGPDGLSTERSASLHAELIPLAGGVNVHQGEEISGMGMEKISLEQVLKYNPEVILVKEKTFFDAVFTDSRWHNIGAVKNKKVYLIPYAPFNWFDRPPSFMRLLGLKWLLNLLHPDRYPVDMSVETRKFYRLFLGVDLTDQDVSAVLGR